MKAKTAAVKFVIIDADVDGHRRRTNGEMVLAVHQIADLAHPGVPRPVVLPDGSRTLLVGGAAIRSDEHRHRDSSSFGPSGIGGNRDGRGSTGCRRNWFAGGVDTASTRARRAVVPGHDRVEGLHPPAHLHHVGVSAHRRGGDAAQDVHGGGLVPASSSETFSSTAGQQTPTTWPPSVGPQPPGGDLVRTKASLSARKNGVGTAPPGELREILVTDSCCGRSPGLAGGQGVGVRSVRGAIASPTASAVSVTPAVPWTYICLRPAMVAAGPPRSARRAGSRGTAARHGAPPR